MTASPLRLGVHVSISGGIEKAVTRARELGCSAMQIFSRNPRGWEASSLDPQSVRKFREEGRKSNIDPVVIHTPYLLNLASRDEQLYRRSIKALIQDLRRADDLGARFVVTHLGSGKESSPAASRRKVIKALREIIEENFSASLLLENSAGAGSAVGVTLEEIAEIIEGAGKDPRIGFCFDSCHGFAAGYDFRSEGQSRALLQAVDRTVGLGRLRLLHLNDCSGPLGAHLDRHQHIGKGKIGLKGFRSLLSQVSFQRTTMILETPKRGVEDDLENLSRIRGIIHSLREQPERRDPAARSG